MSSAPRRVPRRPGRPTAEHEAAVARRLELLRAELAGAPALRAVPDEPDGEATDDDLGPPALVGSGDDWWSPATRVPGAQGPDGSAWAVPPAPVSAPTAAAVLGTEPLRVPVPGRHASRRSRDVWGDLVPETLRGRLALGPTQLTVVAVLIALGLAVTAWTVVRSSPDPLTPGLTPVTDSAVSGAPVAEAPLAVLPSQGAPVAVPPPAAVPAVAAGPGGTVTVDVAGKVRRPGIAVLDAGARIVDAIEAAGGARTGIDLTSLNLARVLVDGEQIVVGVDPPPGVAASALAAAGPAVTPSGATSPGALVNLNSATEADLDTLPDVGPVTAASIITWRTEHGGYTTVDELLEVDGIGEATLARIAPHVTV